MGLYHLGMAKKIQRRTKFDVIREISEIDNELEKRNDPDTYMSTAGSLAGLALVELMKKKARLRHELKMFDATTADGEEAKLIEQTWKQRAQAEQRKNDLKKKEEKKRIAQAKKQMAQEIEKDPDKLEDIVDNLSPAAKKKLLKKLQGKA